MSQLAGTFSGVSQFRNAQEEIALCCWGSGKGESYEVLRSLKPNLDLRLFLSLTVLAVRGRRKDHAATPDIRSRCSYFPQRCVYQIMDRSSVCPEPSPPVCRSQSFSLLPERPCLERRCRESSNWLRGTSHRRTLAGARPRVSARSALRSSGHCRTSPLIGSQNTQRVERFIYFNSASHYFPRQFDLC